MADDRDGRELPHPVDEAPGERLLTDAARREWVDYLTRWELEVYRLVREPAAERHPQTGSLPRLGCPRHRMGVAVISKLARSTMTLIGLLVAVLVFVLVLYLARMIPDATISKIVTIVVIILAILYLLQGFGLLTSGSVLRLH